MILLLKQQFEMQLHFYIIKYLYHSRNMIISFKLDTTSQNIKLSDLKKIFRQCWGSTVSREIVNAFFFKFRTGSFCVILTSRSPTFIVMYVRKRCKWLFAASVSNWQLTLHVVPFVFLTKWNVYNIFISCEKRPKGKTCTTPPYKIRMFVCRLHSWKIYIE